ncbi:MAG: hypothetical protein ACRD44_01095, partial [Bryobacteraceae bacterium]
MRTLVVLALAATAAAADLKPETLRAYEGYVAWTDDRVKTDLSNGSPFLWLAGLAENRRQSVDRQLRKGDLVTQDFRPSDLEVPDGMIHHWVTTAFIPGATLTETLAVLLDFENYGKIHQPYFQRSRLLERKGNDCRV